ncbi:MAG: hypothetical protein ACYC8T_30680 [Myxococcaceae bacterium]
MNRLLAVALLLSSPLALAAKSAKLTEAILLYDKTEFAKAKDRLVTLVDVPSLTDEDRANALVYLAASYQALGDLSSSKAQLLRLARAFPAARVDPGLFLPELVALADEARGEVAREDPPPTPPDKPLAVAAPLQAPGVQRAAPPSLAYAFLPFGVGQFKNGENTKGVLFLAGEVLTLGTFAVTLGMFEGSKSAGEFLSWGRFEDPATAGALHTVYLVSFWTGMALVVGGMVDAIASRSDEPAALSLRVVPNGVVVRF